MAVILRLVVFASLAAVTVATQEGLAMQRVAFAALLLSALTRCLLDERLSLFAAFELGAGLVVLGDDLGGQIVVPEVDPALVDVARRFVVLASSAVVLGYEAFGFRRSVRRRPRFSVEAATTPLATPEGVHRTRAMWVLIALTIYVVWRYMPSALASATRGRIGQDGGSLDQSATGAVLSPLSRSASLVLPGLWVWWFGPQNRRLAFVVSFPVLMLLLMGGTRYYLLVGVAGLMLSGREGKREIRSAVAVSLVVLVLAGWVVTATRTEGLASSFSADQVASSQVRILGGEGVLRTTTQIMDYTSREGNTNGTSLGSVAVFWVPRPIWPGKPTLLGYWFVRQNGARGFSEGHSISSGFGGDILIDFGFGLGAVVLVGVGVAFRLVDEKLRSASLRSRALKLSGGALYGLAFFAGRSLATAMISTVGVLAVSWLVIKVARVDRVRRRPVVELRPGRLLSTPSEVRAH